MLRLILVIMLILLFHLVGAQENPENWCRAGLFTMDATEFNLARVNTRAARAYFYNDFEDVCPSVDNASCREYAYLIPQDVLLIADRSYANFVCAWYKPKEAYGTVGWIERGLLDFIGFDEEPSLTQWQGKWTLEPNTLVISKSSFEYNGLIIEGEAFWHGLNDNVHIGSVFGRALPQGNYLTLFDSDYGCKLELWLLDDFIAARDNKQCGGMNVSFDGVYSR